MTSKLRWYCPYCGLWQPDTDACTRYDGHCAFPPIRHEPPEAENLSERDETVVAAGAPMTDDRLAEIEARLLAVPHWHSNGLKGCQDDISVLLAEVRRLRAELQEVGFILEESCDYGGNCRAIEALCVLARAAV